MDELKDKEQRRTEKNLQQNDKNDARNDQNPVGSDSFNRLGKVDLQNVDEQIHLSGSEVTVPLGWIWNFSSGQTKRCPIIAHTNTRLEN